MCRQSGAAWVRLGRVRAGGRGGWLAAGASDSAEALANAPADRALLARPPWPACWQTMAPLLPLLYR